MKNEGVFYFNGECSRDYNIILTKAPPHIFAEREVESISVAGRSGNLTCDKVRYKNVQLPYECAILPKKGKALREAIEQATALICARAYYVRLENSFHPSVYRMARIAKHVSVESLVEKAGKFTINFDCMPQRWLVSGEIPVTFTAAGTLFNPTEFPAKPLVIVNGSGPGNVTVGTATVQIKALGDQIILDCEMLNAYRKPGEGAAENKNSSVYAPVFPELTPGMNAVSFDGDIESVTVIPRWWTL